MIKTLAMDIRDFWEPIWFIIHILEYVAIYTSSLPHEKIRLFSPESKFVL